MGRLYQAFISTLQNVNSVAPNAFVTFLKKSVSDLEDAEPANPALTKLIDELALIAEQKNFALDAAAVNKFFQKLGEAHFYVLCAARGVVLERIPEAKIKTPDFRWPPQVGQIHFEVKTLSVVDGESGIDEALETSFDAQLDLEGQRNSGKVVSMATSEFAPYGDKGHKSPRLVAVIDTLLEKIRGNIKPEQFSTPNTFLVVNLSMLPPAITEPQALRPVYCDVPSCPTPVSGEIWMIGFGQPGMLIFDEPEFEGKPCIQGRFEKLGVLREYDFIAGVLFVIHPWRRPAEIWGLFREADVSQWRDHQNHPCGEIFKLVGDSWNDGLDSMGWAQTAATLKLNAKGG